MKYLICETVKHFHEIDIDDEIEIYSLMDKTRDILSLYDTGYEAIESILKRYKDKYNFDYNVLPNACGTEIVDIHAIDEIG